MHYFLLAISISLAVIAQIFFKFFALNRTQGESLIDALLDHRLIIGFFLYFVSAILYIISLKKIDLSVAYPSVAISYIFVIIVSHFLFGETITAYKIAGFAFIFLGVSLMWK